MTRYQIIHAVSHERAAALQGRMVQQASVVNVLYPDEPDERRMVVLSLLGGGYLATANDGWWYEVEPLP